MLQCYYYNHNGVFPEREQSPDEREEIDHEQDQIHSTSQRSCRRRYREQLKEEIIDLETTVGKAADKWEAKDEENDIFRLRNRELDAKQKIWWLKRHE